MELQVNGNVNVIVELGPQTLALLTGGMTTAPASKQSVVAAAQPKADAPETTKAETAPKKTETPKAAAKPKKEDPAPFEDLDDETKLSEIQAQVTKGTKKGKSADIKFLLSNFDAKRASELSPDQYDAFYDAITRYHKGEEVTDIFPEEDLG